MPLTVTVQFMISSVAVYTQTAGCTCSVVQAVGGSGVLEGRPEGKKPHRRPRRRYEHNIKMDLGKWDGEARSELIWRRIGGTGSRRL